MMENHFGVSEAGKLIQFLDILNTEENKKLDKLIITGGKKFQLEECLKLNPRLIIK